MILVAGFAVLAVIALVAGAQAQAWAHRRTAVAHTCADALRECPPGETRDDIINALIEFAASQGLRLDPAEVEAMAERADDPLPLNLVLEEWARAHLRLPPGRRLPTRRGGPPDNDESPPRH